MKQPRRMYYVLWVLIASFIFASLASADPMISSRAYVLMDYKTGTVIAQQNPNWELPPASLTKMMTVYLTFKAIKEGRLQMFQRVRVSARAASQPPSSIRLHAGDMPTIQQLLLGAIVPSGNDAAVALAEANAGSVENFVAEMNQEARALGMTHTHFENPNGLPAANHYSTAHDLALLSAALIRDFPQDYGFFSTRSFTFHGFFQRNHNHLLGSYDGVDGLKTGYTNAAGSCLAATAKRGDQRLILVLLGAAHRIIRERESKDLLNYGFDRLKADPIAAYAPSADNVRTVATRH
jgi:serine-type D-Ala-D-Ala carboxypeptidase (penicillin-binding protein 5/6)